MISEDQRSTMESQESQNTYKSQFSYSSLQKSPSREFTTASSSRLARRVASMNRLNERQAYKLRKQAEGEESEREPEVNGILKWRWSKRELTEIYSVKFSNDGNYIAASGGNGNISIYSTNTNSREFILPVKQEIPLPCNSIVFRPDISAYKHKNILAAAYSDGTIRHWHSTSGQLMNTINSDEDIQILFIGYDTKGENFVTAASDNFIRVYDGKTHQKIFSAENIEETGEIGHSHRVFCAKFHPEDKNLIVSGGWDNYIQIWDTRTTNPIRRIFGPHICGDGLDFTDDGLKLLTGSYVKENGLQIFDWESGELQHSKTMNTMLYAAEYSKTKISPKEVGIKLPNRFILTAGSGIVNEFRMLSSDNYKSMATVTNLNCSIYALSISENEKMVAFGGGGKMLMMFDLDEQIEQQK